MKTSAGAHCVHLALALVVAWQATSGWAVVPASMVFWLCIALVAAGIDRVFASHPAEVQATHSASGDTGDGNLAAQVIVRLPRLDAAAKRGIEKTVHDALVRQWRSHIVDVTPYEEERYPRQGICTTVELFLRAGDRLVLAFHPDANASPPAPAWRCDLWPPGATHSQWLDVPANGEMDVPLTQTGVYSIGIGQAYGTARG